MNKPGTYICFAFALLFAAVAPAADAGTPSAPEAAPARAGAGARPAATPLAGWTRLELHASTLLATADAVIERWPGAGEAPDLVRVSTSMRYLGRSKDLVTYTEAPAEGGLPVRWMEIEPGRKAREWRAAADGALVKRRFGLPKGKSAPWKGSWTAGKPERLPPARPADDGTALAPLNAWTFLARLDLVAGRPEAAVPLIGNDGMVPAVTRRAETRPVRLRLRELDAGRDFALEIDAVRIELAPAPDGPDPAVLGLNGPVSLLVDPASGALLQIEGRREGIPGIIRFTLGGVSRRARTRPAIPWPAEARDATVAP